MNATVTVDISKALRVPEGLKAAVVAQLENNGPGPYTDMKTQWGSIYQGAMLRNFDTASRGGGDWAPLTLDTILNRKAGKGGGTRREQRASARGQLRGVRDTKAARASGATLSIRNRQQLKNNLKANLHNERSASKRTKIKNKIAALTGSAGTTILKDSGQLRMSLSIGGNGFQVTRGRASITMGFASIPHKGSGATLAQIASWHNDGAGHNPKRTILIAPDASVVRRMAAAAQVATDQVVANIRRQNGGG